MFQRSLVWFFPVLTIRWWFQTCFLVVITLFLDQDETSFHPSYLLKNNFQSGSTTPDTPPRFNMETQNADLVQMTFLFKEEIFSFKMLHPPQVETLFFAWKKYCFLEDFFTLFTFGGPWSNFLGGELLVSYPIRSMYGIFTYIYHKNHPNVAKYTIHGSYGYCKLLQGAGVFRWDFQIAGGLHQEPAYGEKQCSAPQQDATGECVGEVLFSLPHSFGFF